MFNLPAALLNDERRVSVWQRTGGLIYVHHYPRLWDRFPGPRNDRRWGLGSALFATRTETNSAEILRDGNWNDLCWLWLGRYCAGFARVGRDCDTSPKYALALRVAHDKAGVQFLDSPRRREAARGHSISQQKIATGIATGRRSTRQDSGVRWSSFAVESANKIEQNDTARNDPVRPNAVYRTGLRRQGAAIGLC